ncbi:RrF2 family transcriptional regulator [Microaceticoccus formicicus]|uniref:RrF2 family transcriptional regulator n=1 Tax=Microaceticoccus formicicus TaxID=3118105 RepID=UPI003CD02B24|nr:Rrf2 family transcriptional regulator [Peptoniphilaceae bacterium AMB_02]
MRLSTRGRYGLRVMHYLAKQQNDKPIALSKISTDLDLPLNYLEQLVRKLRESDLVISIRGAQGGYKLTRNPEDISVGEILRVLEQYMSTTECAEGDNVCESENHCVARIVWKKIQNSINLAVDNYTLRDMLEDEDNIENTGDC